MLLVAVFGAASAFNLVPSNIAHRATTKSRIPSFASTIDRNADNPSTENLSADEITALEMKNKEMEDVRMELVQKYVSAGKSPEYAEEEVDKFLSDPDRSEKYLEMRRYAKAQAEELMGFETVFVIGGAFFLGLMGNVGVKYFLAYKEVYPGHDGPIPFL